MSTNYPTSKQTLPNPVSTDLLDNATAALDHDYQHSTLNDTIEALQDKVGIDGDTTNTSHAYKLSEVTSTDKAVGKTATQTLTNKTLTSPQVNFGSDATGDMVYRTSGGVTARLPIGTSGQILQSSAAGIPEWTTNPAAQDASTTAKGVAEEATQAEVDAGTATGGTSARLFVNPSTLFTSGVYAKTKFGGDGSDGALTITSGTTNIDLGGVAYVVKQYTSVSITGTGQLTFSNPSSSGTIIEIKSQGNVTLTSSATPNIDASGMGGAGGAGGAGSFTGYAPGTGSNGTQGIGVQSDLTTHAGQSGSTRTAGVIYTNLYEYTLTAGKLASRGLRIACGSGGGGGQGGQAQGESGTALDGGAGGNGGGALIICCGGALNFTSTLGISVAGKDGGNGVAYSSNDSGGGSGGGGGGAAGMAVILYNSLTSASGTVNTAGGAGGAGGNATDTSGGSGGNPSVAGSGGGGAGSYAGAGGAGGLGPVSANNNGVAGSAAGGAGAGGGGGSGAHVAYNATTTYTGGVGGSAGATSTSTWVVSKNYFYA